jgi:hypothetical protein
MDGGISRVWAHQEDRMAIHIRRRELIVAFGGAAVWPIAAHARTAGGEHADHSGLPCSPERLWLR